MMAMLEKKVMHSWNVTACMGHLLKRHSYRRRPDIKPSHADRCASHPGSP